MTFFIFEEPTHWSGWLYVAFRAEDICWSKGIKKEDYRKILSVQDPSEVFRFIKRFNRPPKSVDNFSYSTNYNRNDGSLRKTVKSSGFND